MCGLVGLIAKNKTGFDFKSSSVFKQLLFSDVVRGQDSTGVFGVNKYGNLIAHKSAQAASDMIKTETFKKFADAIFQDFRFVFGHNRASTRGATTDQNAHPFVEGNICLMHNGTLKSHHHLAKTEVDSHAICHSLNEQGYQETFENLDGAFALIWYNAEEKKLYIARNSERPLHMAETNSCFYFASELKMLDWILARNEIKDYKLYYLQENKTYSWNLNDASKFELTDTPKKKQYTTRQKQNHPFGISSNNKKKTIVKNHESNYSIGEYITFTNKGLGETKKGKLRLEGETDDGLLTQVSCELPRQISTEDFDALCEYEVVTARVSMVYYRNNIQELYLRDPIIYEELKSVNGASFTADFLYRNDTHCHQCGQEIDPQNKEEISKTYVGKHGNRLINLICPDCVEDYKKWKVVNQ